MSADESEFMSVHPVRQISPPAAGTPSTIWSLGLMVLGGLLFHVLSRLWRKIAIHHQRRPKRNTTAPTTSCKSSSRQDSRVISPPVVHAVAKRSVRYKDKGLNAVMENCKAIKSSLRKVQDPEIARKAKIAQLLTKSLPRGPLQITPDKLQLELRALRSVAPVQIPTEESCCTFQQAETPSFLQNARRNLKSVRISTSPPHGSDTENRIPQIVGSTSTDSFSLPQGSDIV